MLRAEHMIAIKINKCGQGDLLFVLPLLFLLLDAFNSSISALSDSCGYHVEFVTRSITTEPWGVT